MIPELKKIRPPAIKWPSAKNYIPAARTSSGIRVNIPVVAGNKLIVGKIGCGKTTLVKEMISADINDEDTYLFGFEVKQGDYSEPFMRPGGLIISYRDIPGKEDKMFKWGMVREIKESEDPESEIKKMAAFLTLHLKKDPSKEIWAQGAAETFEGFMNTIIHCVDGTPSNYDVVQRMRTMSTVNLLKFMSHYKPNKSLLEKYYHFNSRWGIGNSEETKRKLSEYKVPQVGSDILVFLQNMLSSFGGSFLSKDGKHAKFEELFGEDSFGDKDDSLQCDQIEKQSENDDGAFMDIGHIVTLKNSTTGREERFEFLDSIVQEDTGREFVLLLPVLEDDGLVMVLEVEFSDGDEDEEIYVSVEDEDLLYNIFNEFKRKNLSYFSLEE